MFIVFSIKPMNCMTSSTVLVFFMVHLFINTLSLFVFCMKKVEQHN